MLMFIRYHSADLDVTNFACDCRVRLKQFYYSFKRGKHTVI